MDRIFTPENLILLFKAIDREELDLILVGVQAINVWPSYYSNYLKSSEKLLKKERSI
jgi:hypothetical protein